MPAADDLFRPTDQPRARVRAVSEAAVEEASEPAARKPSGRVRHDEKMTVYVTSDELLDIGDGVVARATGQPAVCLASSGPGATNLLTAIADAKLDSIPLVAITGQVPRAMIGTDAFQEVDTYGLTIPITQHNFLVTSAEELLQVIPVSYTHLRAQVHP